MRGVRGWRILCKSYEHSYIWIDGKLKAVDQCIAPFILQLNHAGIKTINSCCGHGKDYPCIVCVPSSEQRLKEFGCKNIKTRQDDGYVFAYFPTHSESGKVYVEKST